MIIPYKTDEEGCIIIRREDTGEDIGILTKEASEKYIACHKEQHEKHNPKCNDPRRGVGYCDCEYYLGPQREILSNFKVFWGWHGENKK